MYNILRVVLFATLISGIIMPSQKVAFSSISKHLSQTGQETILVEETTGGCSDTPVKGCGRRDSSA